MPIMLNARSTQMHRARHNDAVHIHDTFKTFNILYQTLRLSCESDGAERKDRDQERTIRDVAIEIGVSSPLPSQPISIYIYEKKLRRFNALPWWCVVVYDM